VTDSVSLLLLVNQKIVIKARTRQEISNSYEKLYFYLNPVRLYYLSKGIIIHPEATKAHELLSLVKRGEVKDEINNSLKLVQNEFCDTNEYDIYKREIESWASLWQNISVELSLDKSSLRKNYIVHIDCSFSSYYESCWYYDELYNKAMENEKELTFIFPGVVLRVFVLKNVSQLLIEENGLIGLVGYQIETGSRVGFLYEREWEEFKLSFNHLDIIGHSYVKKYTNDENVIKGEEIKDMKLVRSIKSDIDDIVSKLKELNRLFEPFQLDSKSNDKFKEWIGNEISNI
jgi:hypothetical protein